MRKVYIFLACGYTACDEYSVYGLQDDCLTQTVQKTRRTSQDLNDKDLRCFML